MQHEIRNKPDYASLHVVLDKGEQIITESGAMMGMHPDLSMSTNMTGGLLGAAKRMLSGESLFLNTYAATGPQQRLDIAPAQPGDLFHLRLNGSCDIIAQRGAFCASTPGVTLSAKWGGAKSFFGGEGLIMLRCGGSGDLWIASYGAIHEVQVNGSYTVDTTHIVAFEDTLQFNVTKVGGLKSLLLSQEGLVCAFHGHGTLWIQTRSVPALAALMHPFRRVKARDND